MSPRGPLFEYRAWPSEGMPHIEALHHMCGVGEAEIRVDTYILSPSRANWIMIVRGGTHFEIKVKTSVQEPLAAWQTAMRSAFPLRRSVVRTIQDAFPMSELPPHIDGPVDLISWLGSNNATICTLSKRMVRFHGSNWAAELAQVTMKKRRVETFSLKAKKPETVMEMLGMIPGHRLANLDYGAWIKKQVPAPVPVPVAETLPALPAPALAAPARLRLVSPVREEARTHEPAPQEAARDGTATPVHALMSALSRSAPRLRALAGLG